MSAAIPFPPAIDRPSPSQLSRWSLGLVAVYALAVAPLFFLAAFACDEINFFFWVDGFRKNGGGKSALAVLLCPNHAGYGALYWNLYMALCAGWGAKSLWVMRGLAYLAFVAIPAAMYYVGNRVKSPHVLMAILLWASLPMAWWNGKVSGPEVFSVSLAVLGISALLLSRHGHADNATATRWFCAAWLLLGAAAGLKMTAMPALVFGAVLSLSESGGQARLKRVGQLCLLALLGFLVINPFAVFQPHVFLKHLQEGQGQPSLNWTMASHVLSNRAWGWDGAFSGGLFQWGLCPVSLAILGIVFCRNLPRSILIGLTVSFATCWFMILVRGNFLGWYWFAWIPLLILSLFLLSRQPSRFTNLALTSALALNVIAQAGPITGQYQMKFEQARNLQRVDRLQHAVDDALGAGSYDVVIEWYEIAHERGLAIDAPSATEVLLTSPTFGIERAPPTLPDASGNGTPPRRREISSAPFLKIVDAGQQGTGGKKVLMIIGDRLKSVHHLRDFEQYLETQVVPHSPSGTTWRMVSRTDFATLYKITTADELETAKAGDLPNARSRTEERR